MSVLDFYAISVIVCFVLTVLICIYLNRLNANHFLYIQSHDAWLFTVLSLVPFLNMIITGILTVITVGYFVCLIAVKLKLKIKLYK